MEETKVDKAILQVFKELENLQAPPGLDGIDARIWITLMTLLSVVDGVLCCYWKDEVSAKNALLAIAGELGEREWGASETWEAYNEWEERQEKKSKKKNHLRAVGVLEGEQ